MAKAGALKGIFKEMLEDYLRVVEKDAAKGAGKGAGKNAGKEAAEKALKEIETNFKLPSSAKNLPKAEREALEKEMRRQLERQLKHYDGKTPREIIEAMENTGKRTGKVQKEARKEFTEALQKRQQQLVREMDPKDVSAQLKELGHTPTGNPAKDMKNLAEARTKGFMDNVAALHEPDIVGGGKDVIGRHGGSGGLDYSFGDRGVNSSIGAQWPHVKPDLLDKLKQLPPDTPIRLSHGL